MKKSPKYKPFIGSEDDFQKAVAKYLDLRKLLWNHTANERKTKTRFNKRGKAYSVEGSILKAKGVKRGFPDVSIFEPRGNYAGLMIELKVGRKKPSKDQLMWLENLNARGYKAVWTNSLDEVMELVDDYLND